MTVANERWQLPTHNALNRTSAAEDDVVSTTSTLPRSDSSDSNKRTPRCHICKGMNSRTVDRLIRCCACNLYFHEACRKPSLAAVTPPYESSGSKTCLMLTRRRLDWKCYRCLRSVSRRASSVRSSLSFESRDKMLKTTPPQPLHHVTIQNSGHLWDECVLQSRSANPSQQRAAVEREVLPPSTYLLDRVNDSIDPSVASSSKATRGLDSWCKQSVGEASLIAALPVDGLGMAIESSLPAPVPKPPYVPVLLPRNVARSEISNTPSVYSSQVPTTSTCSEYVQALGNASQHQPEGLEQSPRDDRYDLSPSIMGSCCHKMRFFKEAGASNDPWQVLWSEKPSASADIDILAMFVSAMNKSQRVGELRYWRHQILQPKWRMRVLNSDLWESHPCKDSPTSSEP
jgi:hypothetical protein